MKFPAASPNAKSARLLLPGKRAAHCAPLDSSTCTEASADSPPEVAVTVYVPWVGKLVVKVAPVPVAGEPPPDQLIVPDPPSAVKVIWGEVIR